MSRISPYSLRGLVKRALHAAKMADAEFSRNYDSNLPKTEKEVTEFIKERTKVYRDSWIIKPLEAALLKLEKKKKHEEE